MSEPFLERLSKGPLLCDGAMGTMLYARAPESILHGRSFDELVLTDAALVEQIHREYIEAGAQVIETNTFGANSAKLAEYGLGDQVIAINRKAAQLAREAREVSGQPVFIAGAVGPSGVLNIGASLEETAPALVGLRSLFREQITALVEGGVDLIILETFSNLVELRQAVLAAREVGNLTVVAQMTFSEDGESTSGSTPSEAAIMLCALDVPVIGTNCSIGPAGTLDAIEEMMSSIRSLVGAKTTPIWFSAQPNAGLPTRVENRFLYGSTPGVFRRVRSPFCRVRRTADWRMLRHNASAYRGDEGGAFQLSTGSGDDFRRERHQTRAAAGDYSRARCQRREKCRHRDRSYFRFATCAGGRTVCGER